MKRVSVLYLVSLVFLLVVSVSINSQIEVLEFESDKENEAQTVNREFLPKPSPRKTELQPEDLIHRGDIIDVDVLGSVEYDWRGEVSDEGFLTGVNFLEKSLFAACRTEESLAQEIAEGYSKLLNAPTVVVRVLDRSKRPVSTLYGAVSKPQRFKLKRRAFLNELIVLAGGFTDQASGLIRILRQSKTNCELKKETETGIVETESEVEFLKISNQSELEILDISVSDLLKGKEAANPRIRYGDTIEVLVAQPVYIIGAVENPTNIFMRKGMTVSRAIDSAGGITKNGNLKKITVFRRDGVKAEILKVDLSGKKKEDGNDIELKPFDIVQVAGRITDVSETPPILRLDFVRKKEISNLPLRIID